MTEKFDVVDGKEYKASIYSDDNKCLSVGFFEKKDDYWLYLGGFRNFRNVNGGDREFSGQSERVKKIASVFFPWDFPA